MNKFHRVHAFVAGLCATLLSLAGVAGAQNADPAHNHAAMHAELGLKDCEGSHSAARLAHKIVLPFAFYFVLVGHVLGVAKHEYVDAHKGVFRRMVP